MKNAWTPEQVLCLAPDETSRGNARSLAASPRKWSGLCRSEKAVWGECQGSGADPYRCQVELEGPGFKCSCPSRKQPCKHALALLLVFTNQPERFEASRPPDWVTDWLAKRAEQGERRAARAEGRAAPPDTAAQARRAAEREKKIRAGIDDLDTWLCDLLRQGFAWAQPQSYGFWEGMAGRLVDSQAPGLARLVRAMPAICASGEGWQSRLLDAVGRLYLAMEGYRRIDTLPEETQEDLRSVIGFTIKQEDLLAGAEGLRDTWMVLGRHTEEDNPLKSRRVWLWGAESRRPALLLSFAAGGNDLEPGPLPGTSFEAELVFYPGAYPLRAAIRSQETPNPIQHDRLPGDATLSAAVGTYAAALARCPWIERFPLAVRQVVPCPTGGEWSLNDADGRCAPLARAFLHGWRLLAFSGGHPVTVFGEWNGERLLPLSAWDHERLILLPPGLD